MRHLPDSVMLFAAGFGTRMRHLTKDQPKPLVKVAGVPLIEHTLSLAKAISPRKIVANLHYKPTQLEAYLHKQGVETILETPDILETGGGLKNALPLLGRHPLFTANTDAIWQGPNPFSYLRQAWSPDRMDALLLCVPLENTRGHSGTGDFVLDPEGRLRRGAGDVYGGIQIIKTDRLESVVEPAFSLNLVWSQMLEEDRLFGLSYPGRWCDVGSPEGVELAETLLENPDA
ncbi:nucleotidyltransferase family protein [Shimia sp. FJ5]|uniref:nucleotidyltransferase family protein n=1 Tax=Shimia sp. FJ5 TaxID=3079054 RepID=UPI002608094B|nr:nucleotidyltransferase family protein [Shimia sp. FJ5]MDV4144675.1 nucleotidyltransferase family protein [Shimia sp. FJ5]